MRIAVIGTIVYDEIVTHRGERRESFGGITYNVAALESIVDDGTTIVPVAQVGFDRYDQATELLLGCRGVVTDGLRRMEDRRNPHVRLVYTSITARTEHMANVAPPLAPEQIELAAECDAILVNFITGREMSREQFVQLGASAKGHLHLDVHNRITEWLPDGGRKFIGMPDWRDFMAATTTVQMNEFEVEQLLGREVKGEAAYLAAAAEFVRAGASAAMITLGPLGSVMGYNAEDAVRGVVWPAATNLGEVIDTTGCGDSFSAGFLWSYLTHGDPVRANAAGNVVGGVNCVTPGIGNLTRAREADRLIGEAWPDLAKKLTDGWRGTRLAV